MFTLFPYFYVYTTINMGIHVYTSLQNVVSPNLRNLVFAKSVS